LFHYVFVVWLQYVLLDVALFAIAKAAIVFGGTLVLAWATTTAVRFVPGGSLLLGVERRVSPPPPRGPMVLARQSAGDRQDLQLSNSIR
jgi:hypothetical protein